MTFADIKIKLRELDMTITKKDGEYRVNFAGGREATAYYTNDLWDAYYSGKFMRRNLDDNRRNVRR